MAKQEDNQQQAANKDRVLNKAYRYMTGLLIFFFATAVVAALVGKLIDETFKIAPLGTISMLVGFWIASFIVSRLLIAKLNKRSK